MILKICHSLYLKLFFLDIQTLKQFCIPTKMEVGTAEPSGLSKKIGRNLNLETAAIKWPSNGPSYSTLGVLPQTTNVDNIDRSPQQHPK